MVMVLDNKTGSEIIDCLANCRIDTKTWAEINRLITKIAVAMKDDKKTEKAVAVEPAMRDEGGNL
jgi:hypothetical protein